MIHLTCLFGANTHFRRCCPEIFVLCRRHRCGAHELAVPSLRAVVSSELRSDLGEEEDERGAPKWLVGDLKPSETRLEIVLSRVWRLILGKVMVK